MRITLGMDGRFHGAIGPHRFVTNHFKKAVKYMLFLADKPIKRSDIRYYLARVQHVPFIPEW